MKTCDTCHQKKNIPNNRTTCDACRKRAQRSKGAPESPVLVPTDNNTTTIQNVVSNINSDDTSADKAWLKTVAHMGPEWPVRDPLTENTCVNCKKNFKTHFRLLRHCGCK